jgi:hypothetical protein
MVHDFHDLLLAISQANFLLPGRLLYSMNPQLQLRPSELSKTYSPDERHARSENDLPHEKRSQRLISFAAWGENDRMQLVRLGLLLNSIQLRVMRERSGTSCRCLPKVTGNGVQGFLILQRLPSAVIPALGSIIVNEVCWRFGEEPVRKAFSNVLRSCPSSISGIAVN